ncbi:MAG TPA: glycosyltransferase [Verrucomicrobiota bacterium]|nr:glycosyltransferase [Verrucomicrobiota bacterium]HQK00565.1 glycosyltransferase [Verrucomicrobiota bacterium]
MPTLKHIVFLSGNFPSRVHPNRGTFVRALVEAVAQQGVRCSVIHPWKVHEWLRERGRDKGDGGGVIEGVRVYRPITLSLSSRRIGPTNTYRLTHGNFRRAVWRVLNRMRESPDALYGHFLYSAGATAVWAAERLRLPSFVAVGEGGFGTVRPMGIERAKRDFAHLTGAIGVNRVLARRLIAELGLPREKVKTFPNGVDLRAFHAHDRLAMRRKFALAQESFLVAYVGNFIASKGVQRVAQAIDGLPGITGVFVGSGPLTPRIPNVAFCGRLEHKQVAEILSAADCFVLPSDVEGSSNATLEAMACGLPVVVSEGEFNDDIVTPQCAVRVPPLSVQAIREAILELREESGRRKALADGARQRAEQFDIQLRARRILAWMEERVAVARPTCSV